MGREQEDILTAGQGGNRSIRVQPYGIRPPPPSIAPTAIVLLLLLSLISIRIRLLSRRAPSACASLIPVSNLKASEVYTENSRGRPELEDKAAGLAGLPCDMPAPALASPSAPPPPTTTSLARQKVTRLAFEAPYHREQSTAKGWATHLDHRAIVGHLLLCVVTFVGKAMLHQQICSRLD